MSSDTTIGVFHGGRSPEHDVSVITGTLIAAGLTGLGYKVVSIYAGKRGEWYVSEELNDVKRYRNKEVDFSKYGGWSIDLEQSKGKIVFSKKSLLKNENVEINIAFPAFHGQNGEDGAAMGLFEMFGVPYVGCDHTASAVAMDKVITKQLYEYYGFKTTKFTHFLASDWKENKDNILKRIEEKLKYPLFVKPARLGSSIGIAKVSKQADLVEAIEVALHYENKVLVEEGVSNMADITCALLGGTNPRASLLQESHHSGGFVSYDDKYIIDGGVQLGEGGEKLVIPAELPEGVTEKIQEIAKEVFVKFGCFGTARVDFLYDTKANEIYVNEINTLPGTLYHHLWERSGVELPELLTELINLSKEREKERHHLTSTFESEILRQSGGGGKLGGSKLG